MAHFLVEQLRFTRAEFLRCLDGVSEEDAVKKLEPMNCISWIVGHMAVHENFIWVKTAQDVSLFPGLRERTGYGEPPTTPPLGEMWQAWREITSSADPFLDTLTTETLHSYFDINGKPAHENVGTMLLRNIYHYWFHTGEAHAIRQQLRHKDLPDFVGNMSGAFFHLDGE